MKNHNSETDSKVEAEERREAFFSINGDELPSESDFRNKVIGSGVLRARGGKFADEIIPITPSNEIFFFKRADSTVLELTYQGSGLIVSLLTHSVETDHEKSAEEKRPLSLFDVKGNFYDNIHLLELNEEYIKNGHEVIKHSAVFKYPRSTESFELAIDDIHCVGGAVVDEHINSEVPTAEFSIKA